MFLLKEEKKIGFAVICYGLWKGKKLEKIIGKILFCSEFEIGIRYEDTDLITSLRIRPCL